MRLQRVKFMFPERKRMTRRKGLREKRVRGRVNSRQNLYILNTIRCPYLAYVTYIRSSVTLGVASSVANDVIMRTGAARAQMTS